MKRPARAYPLPDGFAFYDYDKSPLIVPKPVAAEIASQRARDDEGEPCDPFTGEPLGPPAAETQAPPVAAAVKRRRDRVPVFAQEALQEAVAQISKLRREDKARLLPPLEMAARDGGMRQVRRPSPRTLPGLLAGLTGDFPNFGAVIEALAPEWALQAGQAAAGFRLSPLLLYGAPGVGKTFFASRLAGRLGVDWEQISAGTTQGAFEVTGTSRHWATANPGRVFRLLARSRYASSVLLIDEVDKLGQDQQNPVLPALLDLLEEDSARRLRDVGMDLMCDASRLLVILTANDIERVPAPLRSRVQEIAVASPTRDERVAIATRLADDLRRPLRKAARVAIDRETLEALASAPVDLRELKRRLRRAVGQAVLAGRRRLAPADVGAMARPETRPRMGFV